MFETFGLILAVSAYCMVPICALWIGASNIECSAEMDEREFEEYWTNNPHYLSSQYKNCGYSEEQWKKLDSVV